MTYEEYQRRRKELLNAETELAEEFVRDNPFNQYVGKKVRINRHVYRYTIMKEEIGWGEEVIFEGLMVGFGTVPDIRYRKIKKDGTPYAVEYYRRLADWTEIKLAE